MEIFKHVYIINLEKDTQKMEKISANLKKYNIKFERFDAIYGKKLSQKEIEEKTTFLCRTLFCNKGVIGCALSHMTLWERIAQSQDKWHLILEDDIEFNDEHMKLFQQLNDYLMKNPEIDAYINLNCHNANQLFCRFMSSNNLIAKNLLGSGFSAYLITPKMAANLLEKLNRKVSGHIDLNISLKTLTQKNMFITKKRFGRHNYNVYESNDMEPNIMPILSYVLNKIGLEEYVFLFNCVFMTFWMKYEINMFIIFYITLALLNCFWWDNSLLYIYLIIEFIFYNIIRSKRI